MERHSVRFPISSGPTPPPKLCYSCSSTRLAAFLFGVTIYLSVTIPGLRTVLADPADVAKLILKGGDGSTEADRVEALRVMCAGNSLIVLCLVGVLCLQVRVSSVIADYSRLTNVFRRGKNMLIALNNASERSSQSWTRKRLLPLRQGLLKEASRRQPLRKRKRTNDHDDCFFLSPLLPPRDVTLCIPDLSYHTIMFPCLPVMCFGRFLTSDVGGIYLDVLNTRLVPLGDTRAQERHSDEMIENDDLAGLN